MATMQEVTLGNIVDVRGTVYGPGTIRVPLDIAERLIKFHDAQGGTIIAEDIADLLKMPVDMLTAEQLALVMQHKRGVQPSAAPSGDANSADVVQRIMALDIGEIRKQLTERGATFPGNAGKKQLAELLAKSAGYQVPQAQQPPPPQLPTGTLPEKFPAREKLTELGLDTIEKVKASKPEDWHTLDQNEKDMVAAELATS